MKSSKQIKRTARQFYSSCLVSGLLDENRVRRVVRGLAQTTRRDRFRVLSQFRRLVRLDEARHTAMVESALPLPQDLQASVESRLARRYGAGLNVEFATKPALIAGMRIRVASDVYDGSVKGGLDQLQSHF